MKTRLSRIEGGRQTRRLAGDAGGATAVEFAIVAPVFLLLVFVIAEIGLLFLAELMLDRATKETARLVRTGQVHVRNLNKQEFQEEFCRNLLVLSCSADSLYLDVSAYDSFAAMDTTPPVSGGGGFTGSGNASFGQGSDIVVVRAYYQWPTSPIIGQLTLANLENGRRLISAFTAFRNEPFPSSGGAVATAGGAAGGAP